MDDEDSNDTAGVGEEKLPNGSTRSSVVPGSQPKGKD